MTSTQSANSRRRPRWSIESVAGWVFADLFLVLFLVGLGSAVPIKPTVRPTPKPTPTATPKPKPTATSKPSPPPIIGMKQQPVIRPIAVDAGALVSSGPSGTREGAVACLRVRQAAAALRGERAGLVLIFGGGPEVTDGQSVARGVAKQLNCADPALFPRSIVSRPFWDGNLGYGQVRLEIFVFTTKKPT